MSYEIIKHIKVKDDKVLISSACNNVYPRDYYYQECKSLSKILQEQGREELDIEILKAYEEGNFQKGNNRYTKALHRLRQIEEYKKFNWRNVGEAYEIANKLRQTKAFNDILREAMNSKFPKDRFIISKANGLNNLAVYLYKTTKKYANWTTDITKAKQFYYENEANGLQSCYNTCTEWKVIKIK